MCDRAPLLDHHKFAFEHLWLVWGTRCGLVDLAATGPLTPGQQETAADQQHACYNQPKHQQNADERYAKQQRKSTNQRVAGTTHGRHGKLHVLKIRVVKSTTYACNDGAIRPARQVPMDTTPMETVPPEAVTPAPPLCRLNEIPDGGATAVDAMLVDGEESLILLRHGEHVQAYLNICPHTARRLDYAPGKFLLKNDTLICAVHGATFNQADGLCIAGPCRGEHLRTVAIRVENDGTVHLATGA